MTTIASSGPVSLGSVRGLFDTAGNLDLSAGAIFRNGNVGIGTTNPLAKLSIGNESGGVVDGILCSNSTANDNQVFAIRNRNYVNGEAGSIEFIHNSLSNFTSAIQMKVNSGSGSVDALRIASNGNVGIGTNNPLVRLDISGRAIIRKSENLVAVADCGLLIAHDGRVDKNEFDASGHSLVVASDTNINNRMLLIIDADDFNNCCGLQSARNGQSVRSLVLNAQGGNVGIGTANPLYRFTTDSFVPSEAFPQIAITDRTNPRYACGMNFRDATTLNLCVGEAVDNASQLGSSSVKMTIQSNGNVGIGTTNPSTILDVGPTGNGILSKNAVLGRGADADFNVSIFSDRRSNLSDSIIGGIGMFYKDTLNSFVQFHRGGGIDDGYVSFGSNGLRRMTIFSGGEVGIGSNCTVNGIATVTDEIRVGWQFGDTSGALVRRHVSGGEIIGIDRNFDVAGLVLGSAANLLRISGYTTNGTVTTINTNGTISVTSDVRSKTAIEDISFDPLAVVMELRPRIFRYLSDLSSVRLGFVAQEVEKHLPLAVDGKKYEYEFLRDGNDNIMTNEDGSPQLDMSKPRFRGFDTNAVVAAAVGAIKQLKVMVEAQQEEINALKAQLSAGSA